MPPCVRDPDVDRLASRLATLMGTRKTEAVRQAHLHELERIERFPSLVEDGFAFVGALRARTAPPSMLGGKPRLRSSRGAGNFSTASTA
jgi:antitoxin VapB